MNEELWPTFPTLVDDPRVMYLTPIRLRFWRWRECDGSYVNMQEKFGPPPTMMPCEDDPVFTCPIHSGL